MTATKFFTPNPRPDSLDLVQYLTTWSTKIPAVFPGKFYLGDLSKLFEVTAYNDVDHTLLAIRLNCTPPEVEEELFDEQDAVYELLLNADRESKRTLLDLDHMSIIDSNDFIFSLPVAERKTHLLLSDVDNKLYFVEGATPIVYTLNYYGKWLSPADTIRASIYGKTLVTALCASFGGFSMKNTNTGGLGALDFPKGGKDKEINKIPPESLKELEAIALALRASYQKKTEPLSVVTTATMLLLSDVLANGIGAEALVVSHKNTILIGIDTLAQVVKEAYITSGVTYIKFHKDISNPLKNSISAQISAPNLVILTDKGE